MMMALPVMAAASYYLVVLNGPTPVVKERSSDSIMGPSVTDVIVHIVNSLLDQQ